MKANRLSTLKDFYRGSKRKIGGLAGLAVGPDAYIGTHEGAHLAEAWRRGYPIYPDETNLGDTFFIEKGEDARIFSNVDSSSYGHYAREHIGGPISESFRERSLEPVAEPVAGLGRAVGESVNHGSTEPLKEAISETAGHGFLDNVREWDLGYARHAAVDNANDALSILMAGHLGVTAANLGFATYSVLNEESKPGRASFARGVSTVMGLGQVANVAADVALNVTSSDIHHISEYLDWSPTLTAVSIAVPALAATALSWLPRWVKRRRAKHEDGEDELPDEDFMTHEEYFSELDEAVE